MTFDQEAGFKQSMLRQQGTGPLTRGTGLCGHRTERRAPVEGCVTAECTLTARRSWQVRLEVLRPGVPRRGVGDRLTLAMGLPT